MAWLIRLDNKEDHEWLTVAVEGAMERAQANATIYPERAIIIERVYKAIQNATKTTTTSELVPIAGPGRKTKKVSTSIPPPKLCPTHKTYGGRRSPRTDCPDCWDVYEKYNGPAAARAARIRFHRKTKSQ